MPTLRVIFDTVERHIPSIVSKYAKRLLEPVYDWLFTTYLGRYCRSLNSSQKHAIEASMYIATEFLDSGLKGNTPLKQITREVVVDAAPEIAKRLLNGPESSSLPADSKEKGWPVVETMTEDIKKLRQKLRH